jgi:hypothetical protein
MRDSLVVDIEIIPDTERWSWQKPQCECTTVPQIILPERVSRRCKHTAVYILNGKKLCERHTGRELIRLACACKKETTNG